MRKLYRLRYNGFNAWYDRACELTKENAVDVEDKYIEHAIKFTVAETFMIYWYSNAD